MLSNCLWLKCVSSLFLSLSHFFFFWGDRKGSKSLLKSVTVICFQIHFSLSVCVAFKLIFKILDFRFLSISIYVCRHVWKYLFTIYHLSIHIQIISNSNYCCCCSVPQLCLTLCNLMDYSMPGFPVLHHLLEFDQTHVHWVSDVI